MEMILIAKTKVGNIIVLTKKMRRSELKVLRESERFYCPQCEEQLLLKVGNYKIPHFSHRQQTACRSLFSEGETVNHLAGKQQLYSFFKETKRLDVQMEPYMKALGQRPDLLVETRSRKIPIEFQCSNIPVSEVSKRTTGYKNAQMDPLWILQTPKKIRQLPQGITVYSLSRFEECFLMPSSIGQKILFTYEPQSENFHYLSSFLHVEGRKFIVNHRKLSITRQTFPFARPNFPTFHELQNYMSIYTSERSKFLRNRVFYNRRGIKDPFLKRCYQLRLIPSELPIWIGVPVQFGGSFHVHDCEWQLAFLYFLTKKDIKVQNVTANDIYEFAYEYGDLDTTAIVSYEKYLEFLLFSGINSVFEQLSKEKLANFKNILSEYLQKGLNIEKI